MTSLVHILIIGMITNLISIFILFAPPANQYFHNHPECSITFSPDLSTKQKEFCREWNKK